MCVCVWRSEDLLLRVTEAEYAVGTAEGLHCKAGPDCHISDKRLK